MCLSCYPGPCSRYHCPKVKANVAFVCDRCSRSAIAGGFDDVHSVTTSSGYTVCGTCVYHLCEGGQA